jgi:hypothetical protein
LKKNNQVSGYNVVAVLEMPNAHDQRIFLKLVGLDHLYNDKNMKVKVTADDTNNTDIVDIKFDRPEGFEGQLYTKEIGTKRENGRILRINIDGLTREYNQVGK